MSTFLWAFFFSAINMKKIAILLLVCQISIGLSQTSGDVLSFEYKKENQGVARESVVVYYDKFEGSYMLVTEPVIQRIKMISDRLLYYYPLKKMALTMNNPDALTATTPVQLFINTGSEDMGLNAMGFTLSGHEMLGDTLIKTWELKGKKKKEYIRIDVFAKEMEVFKTLSYDADKNLIKEVAYSNWIELNNYAFPLTIAIKEKDNSDTYVFSKVKNIEFIPDSIKAKFYLPEDCEIHEYVF